MKISLTFDNGPDGKQTPHVLNVLAQFGVKATFFPLGKHLAVPALHDLAVEAFAAGHRIGNHSYNHGVPLGLLETPSDAVREISDSDAVIGNLGGTERLFRPFGRAHIGPHLLNAMAWQYLIERQFTCVLWNYVAAEREYPVDWVDLALVACSERPWSVIVMHDIPEGGVLQLEYLLDGLLKRSAQFSQDFPSECTPLIKGVPTGEFTHLMPSAKHPPDTRFIAPTVV